MAVRVCEGTRSWRLGHAQVPVLSLEEHCTTFQLRSLGPIECHVSLKQHKRTCVQARMEGKLTSDLLLVPETTNPTHISFYERIGQSLRLIVLTTPNRHATRTRGLASFQSCFHLLYVYWEFAHVCFAFETQATPGNVPIFLWKEDDVWSSVA